MINLLHEDCEDNKRRFLVEYWTVDGNSSSEWIEGTDPVAAHTAAESTQRKSLHLTGAAIREFMVTEYHSNK